MINACGEMNPVSNDETSSVDLKQIFTRLTITKRDKIIAQRLYRDTEIQWLATINWILRRQLVGLTVIFILCRDLEELSHCIALL